MAKKEEALNSHQQIRDEKSIQQLKSEFDYYILFLDPESLIYYRKIIGRDDFIRLETLEFNDDSNQQIKTEIDDNLIKHQMKRKNLNALKEIVKSLELQNFSWTFIGEADSFRRRPFPLHFLQYESSDYPTYVHESKLSKAFDQFNGIETIIDLSEYANLIKAHDSTVSALKKSEFTYESKESLVTSTKEFIRNVIRYVYHKFNKTIIKAETGYILTLKVQGFREYLLGNYQLLHYERVRQCLRTGSKLSVVLTEINLNFRDQYFPPLFKMPKQITYPIIHLKKYKFEQQQRELDEWLRKQENLSRQYQALKNERQKNQANTVGVQGVLSGQRNTIQFGTTSNNAPSAINKLRQDMQEEAQRLAELKQAPPKDYHLSDDEIRRELLKNKYDVSKDYFELPKLFESSQYFWYSPVSNLQMEAKNLREERQKIEQPGLYVIKDNPRIEVNNGLTESDMTKMNWVNVPIEKKKISLSRHRFLNKGTTRTDKNQQVVIESGEINYKFRLKLVSLERIVKIFEEIREPVATNNLENTPFNVTLSKKKVINRHKKEREERNTQELMQKVGEIENLFARQHDSEVQNILKTDKRKDETINIKLLKYIEAANKTRLFSEQISKLKKGDQLFKVKQQYEKIQNLWQSKNFERILHFKKNKKYTVSEEEFNEFVQYKEKQFEGIQNPLCNFSDGIQTIEHYKNILRFSIGNYTPLKIRVQCTLYHGAEKLVDKQVCAEVYFSNNIIINKWLDFGNLKYCQLPMKTRIAFNIICIFKETGHELTIATVSQNLFDEKKRFRSGQQGFNLWPFYENDPRLGCMKEYKGRKYSQGEHRDRIIDNIHGSFSKLVVEFETFICPMYYSSRDLQQIKMYGLMENEEDIIDKREMLDQDNEQTNKKLSELKRQFEKTSLDELSDDDKKTLFTTREHYQTYPRGLPLFLRSVQWHRPLQVNETYKILENWAPMEPSEAIILLDAKFPDERVRSYAVKRINNLSDDDLALYMLQFSQALMYEESHFSPLADMLIQRSLRNPHIVGLTFYWALKGNLFQKPSYERYYLLLEQFLMLCGKYRVQLFLQLQVNEGLKITQKAVIMEYYKKEELKEMPWLIHNYKQDKRQINSNSNDLIDFDEEKKSKEDEKENKFDKAKKIGRLTLLNQKQTNMPLVFNTPLNPKFVVRDFVYEKVGIFKSAKVPMLLIMQNAQRGGGIAKAMFKNGDDLRQDILTLQLIKIMDNIWLKNSLDLKMSPYSVVGTDCMQGYLEFVDNSTTLARIQYDGKLPFHRKEGNIFNTFDDTSIMRFMTKKAKAKHEKEIREARNIGSNESLSPEDLRDLDQMVEETICQQRKIFAKSVAGYCVASYVLGLGDRHPDNILIVDDGHFAHIDFGHFLGEKNKKRKKLGKLFGKKIEIRRETDPFVLTPEIAYFINGGPFKLSAWQKIFGTKKINQQVELTTKQQEDGLQLSQIETMQRKGTTVKRFRSTRMGRSDSMEDENQSYEFEDEDEILLDKVAKEDDDQVSKVMEQALSQMKRKHGEGQEFLIQGNYIKSRAFLEFEKDCCTAFNILRKEGKHLINLFLIMMSAGMPELQTEKDLDHLIQILAFELTDQEASMKMKQEINEAMDGFCTTRRRLDNFAHNIKQVYL